MVDLICPEQKDPTHFLYYVLAAAANATAMVTSNLALKWLTYPMQVIFKSAKPISIMISGLVFCKRYPIRRYFFVVLIVIGVVMFKYFEVKENKVPKKSQDGEIASNKDTNTNSNSIMNDYGLIGTLLLILSLCMDGLLGVIQDKIKDKYKPNFKQFMIGLSSYGAIILITIVIVIGEVETFFQFTTRHPIILLHITTYAVCGVCGQVFIYIMVSCFGSLACSVTTTTRKFFSVLFSIIMFQNPSTMEQWCGAILVFLGLFADAFFGKKRTTKTNESELHAQNTEILVDKSTINPSITKTQQNANEIV